MNKALGKGSSYFTFAINSDLSKTWEKTNVQKRDNYYAQINKERLSAFASFENRAGILSRHGDLFIQV